MSTEKRSAEDLIIAGLSELKSGNYSNTNEAPEKPDEDASAEVNDANDTYVESDVPDEDIPDEDAKSDDDIYSSLSTIEKEAWDDGWRPKDIFIKEGGDPEKYVSPREHIRFGKALKVNADLREELDRTRSDFETRFTNLTTHYQSKLQSELEDLTKQRREAMLNADDEQFDKFEARITKINEDLKKFDEPTAPAVAPSQPTGQKPPVEPPEIIKKWRADNPWIDDPTDNRSHFANSTWNAYLKRHPSASDPEILEYVNKELRKVFPTKTNPMRTAAISTESGKNIQSSRKAASQSTLSFTQLTREERRDWERFKDSVWRRKDGTYNEEGFLKTVMDVRRYSSNSSRR